MRFYELKRRKHSSSSVVAGGGGKGGGGNKENNVLLVTAILNKGHGVRGAVAASNNAIAKVKESDSSSDSDSGRSSSDMIKGVIAHGKDYDCSSGPPPIKCDQRSLYCRGSALT